MRVDLYVLVKYDNEGNPLLEMGSEGQVRYNFKRRIFYNERAAKNYAAKVGGARIIRLVIPNEGEDPYAYISEAL